MRIRLAAAFKQFNIAKRSAHQVRPQHGNLGTLLLLVIAIIEALIVIRLLKAHFSGIGSM